MRHHQGVLFDPVEEAGGRKIGDHLLARLEPVQAAIGGGYGVRQLGVLIEDVGERKTMPPPDLEIGKIVSRSDLNGAAAGLWIRMLVGNNRHQTVGERKAHGFSDQIAKSLIIRVDRDPAVAEHRFGPGCGHNDKSARHIRYRITDMPQRTDGLAVFDLEIRDHGVHHRVPVDEPLVAVDEAFAIEPYEDAANRGRKTGVHGKALAAPVWRGTKPAKLTGDRAARLLLPFPYTRDKSVPAEIPLCVAFFCEL